MKGRSTTDKIIILKESLAKYWEDDKECFCLFIELKKAFLTENKIWEKIKNLGYQMNQ